MKPLQTMLAMVLVPFALSAQANLITQTQPGGLVITPLGDPVITGDSARLFTLIPLFGPAASNPPFSVERTFAFSQQSSSITVEVSETVNGDGTGTRTESEVRTTTQRVLTRLTIAGITDLDESFSVGDEVNLNGNSFMLDFSGSTLLDSSSLVFDIAFTSTSMSEIVSLSEESIAPTMVDVSETAAMVPAPSALLLLSTGLMLLLRSMSRVTASGAA